MSRRFLPERSRRFAPCAIAYLVLSAALIASAAACRKPDQNLIVNGKLTATNGFFPKGWWPSPQADCDALQWFHPTGTAGELRISHARLYDAGGWDQSVDLQPGWYRLSAEVRSEDGGASDGALMTVKVGVLSSAVASSSPEWMPVDLYFKLPAAGPVSIQCRLHNSRGHRTKAFFRNVGLVKVSAPAPGAASQIDFSKLPQQGWPPEEQNEWNPVFSDWRPAVATVLVVCATFGAFWFWLNPARLRSLASSEAARDRWTKRGVALFFAITLVFMFAMTWIQWIGGVGFRIVKPRAASSDEPYYVMVVNSILFDHDLELQDDYRRVAQGGLEAGRLWAGFGVDHHTLIVNRRTGRHLMGAWQTSDVVLRRRHCNPEFDASSPDVYEVSAHPVAWPALIALALAPFHPAIGDVETDGAIFLGLLSFLTAVVTYPTARRDGMSRGWSMTTVMILVGGSSWLAYSRSFFPESGIGLAMILCMWAWMAERPVLVAFPAAIAAVFKPPFAVVGAGIILDEFRCGRRREAIEAGVVLGACALALMAFNYWHAKTFFIGGVGGGLHASIVYTHAMNFVGMVESFVDPLHSVILFVPWTIVAFVAIAREAPYRNAEGRMLRRMALPIALYILILGIFGAYPGLSYGPRYWIAFLPWMALATVHSIRRADRPAQLACSVLVLIAIVIAIPGALRYPHLFRKPPWVEFYGW